MSDSAALVLPPFRRLLDTHAGIRRHQDPYHGPFEAYHHHATAAQSWDLDSIAQVANDCDGPFLDVGCGRGRLALRLARSHRSVTAIDISAQAITHLQTEAGPELLEYLHVITGDVRDTALLPANCFAGAALADLSINSFATGAAVIELFSAVRRCLRADGLLCLPVLRPESLDHFSRLRGMILSPFTDDSGEQRLVWIAMRYDADGPIFRRTLFIQDANAPDGSVRGHVTAVAERLWTVETLARHVTAAGLRIAEKRPLTLPTYPQSITADLLLLRHERN